MSHPSLFFRLLLLTVLAPFVFATARAGQIVEGDLNDALVTQNAVNSQFYQNNQNLEVGALYNGDFGNVVECFPLPFLAPGQTVTGATISFYLESKNVTPSMNGQLYGIKRVSTTSPVPLVSDYYLGTNDSKNTLLDAKFVVPGSAPGQAYSYSGSNLVSFIQGQYANSAFNGLGTSNARYVFFRLSPDATGTVGGANYQFASARHENRTYHPTLTLTVSGGLTATAGQMQFSFSLPQASVTSAGVYNTATGGLIRTLWNNVQYASGANYGVWDGKDDNGNAVAAGSNYQIKLIYHNVQYIWQGVVGNTSASAVGSNTYRSLINMQDMAIANGKAFYTVGYNELQNPFHYFTVGNPQVTNSLPCSYGDPFSSIELVAADATHSYWAKGTGGQSGSDTYIIAINQSNSTYYTFPAGVAPSGSNQNYPSCIDYDTTPNQPNPATGLAVQQSGNSLFVAHENLNVVRVYDKVQGSSLGAFAVPSPAGLATTAKGDVWVISNASTPVVQRYTFSGGKATLKTTITGLSDPVGIAVSADDSTVVIADGGASQQIKGFSNSTGASVWTYGTHGGMPANGPNVTSNCFDFLTQTYVAFQADNTFWIGDQGNMRQLHFSISNGTLVYAEQIMYKDVSYQSTVDLTDATRVFNQFLEYSVNYSIPLGGTNGSWKLVKNWAYGLPNDSQHMYFTSPTGSGTEIGLTSVVTLSNGHTYGLLTNYANLKYDLVELPSSGPARLTGDTFETQPRLYEDGSMRFNITGASSISFYSQALTGFDADNNPKWGMPSLIASAPFGTVNPGTWNAFIERTEMTASGYVIDFDGAEAHLGYHLGAIAKAGTNWNWLASPSTPAGYTGWFPQDGHFDVGNSVEYAGNVAMAMGRNIIYGYHGEFWKNNEASQWVNYLDNGLMVGRFGTLGIDCTGDNAVAGFSGNSFAPTLVHGPDGNVYLYHNEECAHGGTVRWLIKGWDGITELDGTSTLGQTVALSGNTAGPTVTVTSPTAGAIYVNGGNLTVSAQTASLGASIASVQFFDGSTSLGSVTTAPYSLPVTGLGAGSHSITAKVTDSKGASTTSAAVAITVTADGTVTPPPAPLTVSTGSVTSNTVSLVWTEPSVSTTSSTVGQMINLQLDCTPALTLASTDIAGAPGYASSHYNIISSQATNGPIFINAINSNGQTIPNLGIDLAVEGRVNDQSILSLTGTAVKLFGNEGSTYNTDPAITVTNIPYAAYDLVVYSMPENITLPQLLLGAKTSYVTVSNNVGSGTIKQTFNALQTGYNVTTVPFGTSTSVTNKNTIVIQGLSSQSFILQGVAIEAVQIVERPYDQGSPTSYAIQRAGGSGNFTTVGTASGGALSFNDANALSASSSYRYRLQAINSAGVSAYSNVVSVTTAAPISSTPTLSFPTFTAWQSHYFTAAQIANPSFSGPGADPYGTGVPNLIAYALQLDPTTAQPSDLPHPTLVNGFLTVTYTIPSVVTDISFVVQVSPDLSTWQSGSSYTQVVSTTPNANGTAYTVQDLTSVAATKHFMRLQITQH